MAEEPKRSHEEPTQGAIGAIAELKIPETQNIRTRNFQTEICTGTTAPKHNPYLQRSQIIQKVSIG